MKKEFRNTLFSVLFFSALWGFSEAVLGGYLYRHSVPCASVYLTVIGLSVLTVARAFMPAAGMMTLVAAFAMLYKFLNTPFFACHFLGILLTGMCYDGVFNLLRIKNKPLGALLTVYAGYALFAIMITYLFRYEYWVAGGLAKVARHIFVNGTFTALACALAVPLSARLAGRLKSNPPAPLWAGSLARLRMAAVTTGMWLFALVVFVVQFGGGRG